MTLGKGTLNDFLPVPHKRTEAPPANARDQTAPEIASLGRLTRPWSGRLRRPKPASESSVHTTEASRVSEPQQCAQKGCRKMVRFANTELCEDCFADNAAKYNGKDRSVVIPYRSERESDVQAVNKFTQGQP